MRRGGQPLALTRFFLINFGYDRNLSKKSLPDGKNAGFTLIELLVVVLIIGILAAVAFPQYELAVEKARAAEPLAVLRSLRDAQEVYYLANGTYAVSFDELDIEVPESKNFSYTIGGVSSSSSQVVSVGVYSNKKPYLLAYRVSEGGLRYPIICGTDNGANADDLAYAKKICAVLGANIAINEAGTNNRPRWPIGK